MAESAWTRLRRRLITRKGAPDPRQHQYTVLVCVAVVAGTALGWYFGQATPALIAGLTATLALTATSGQSLHSDLRRLAWLAPALVVTMTVGPLLVNAPVLAGIVVVLVVFGAGMLPALGEHYRVGGQLFAAATLFATTTGIGAGQPFLVLLAAAASGAVFALLLRVIIGLSDPDRATRVAVARTLTEPGPGVVEAAASAWRADGSVTWLGQVLAGAARFRAARETLLAQAQQSDHIEAQRLRQIVAEADTVAAELAKSVRARACTGLPWAARRDPAQAVVARGGRQDLPNAVQGLNQGLHRIRGAVVERVAIALPPADKGAHRAKLRNALTAHLSLRSALFRHALRCTLAVTVGMVIVLLLRDPSASSLLLSLYVVLQPAARDSMTGALERTGGAVLGVTALALLITLLPGAYLLIPLVIGGMLLNMPRLRAEYQMLLSSLIVVTVVDQAMRLDRPLVNVGISFAANTAVGAAIALIVGYLAYLVLPSSVGPDVRGAVQSTVWSVSELLRSVRASGQGVVLPAALQSANVLALRRTQDLMGMPAMLDASGEEIGDHQAVQAAAVALDSLRQDVSTLAFRPESERVVAVPALRAVDDLLGGKASAAIPDVPAGNVPATELLASSLLENALHARKAIDQTFGYDDPWKSYTISFVRPERLRIK